jgi:DNA-binding transcriptional ArsR family regulator
MDLMACWIVTKAYSHPAIRDVPLHAVMQALSDPCRVAIVRELLQASGRALACNEVRLNISKATRSHHFEVLRAAGIIHTETEGTKCMTSLRRKELNTRFPGLLKLIANSQAQPLSCLAMEDERPLAG